jgi:Kef-type K+ transport system membrane component KefB
MTPSSLFLLEAFVIVALPVVLLRISGLKGLMPLVAVQIAVGIAMGPSIFGRIAPDYFQIFTRPETLSSLSGVAFVAVLIFGMISGLHLDPGVFNGKERAFWPVAVANIATPMTLGCLAGIWIIARHPEELLPSVSNFEFATAVGICVSMSALPVLGAILGEMDLLGHRVGNLALGISGVNNLVLWIVLGVLLTASAGNGHEGHGLPPAYLIVLLPTYLLVMIRFVRPLLGHMVLARVQDDSIHARGLVVVGAATFASALVTELMGLHYILGAFLIGVVMPIRLRRPILERLHVMSVALLMPFFFTLVGMRTFIDLDSSVLFEVLVVTVLAAAVGIVGGTAFASVLYGEKWRFSLGLGALLQSKGLTELIVLTVLLDAHIISSRVFSAMILMALVSTAFAMPLARLMLARTSERKLIGAAVAPAPDHGT